MRGAVSHRVGRQYAVTAERHGLIAESEDLLYGSDVVDFEKIAGGMAEISTVGGVEMTDASGNGAGVEPVAYHGKASEVIAFEM